MKQLLALSLLCFFSQSLFADGYPDEFKGFFDYLERQVTVSIAGEHDDVMINAFVQFEQVRLDSDSQGKAQLTYFLQGKGVKRDVIEHILLQLESGVSSDASCKGRITQCVLSADKEQPKFLYDYDDLVITIFLPTNALISSFESVTYASAYKEELAVVNWMDIYGFYDFDNQYRMNINNNTTIGLPVGHLSLDTEYRTRDEEFELYSALYDAELDDKRFQAGRTQYNLSFNSTDYLRDGADFAGDSAFVGSSSNLIEQKNRAVQKIYFYAPRNSQLEVYRDERLILNRPVSEGKQSVSYSELPQGVYDIQLVLTVANDVLLDETHKVVNNGSFRLKPGDVDYVIGFGQFEKNEHLNEPTYDTYRRQYGSALGNYRLTPQWMIGAGITLDRDAQYYQLGTTYLLDKGASFEYTGGFFSSGERSQKVRLEYAPFFVDYQEFQVLEGEGNFGMAEQLYGDRSFRDVNVGITGVFLGGNGYISYNFNETRSEQDLEHSNLLSSGWSYQLPTGQLNLNLDVSEYEDDEWEVRSVISYRLNLGDDYTAQFGFYTDSDGFDYNRNSLNMNKQKGDWYTTTSVGAKVDRNHEIIADVSGTASGKTRYVNMNGYGFADDQGGKSVSGSLSGSQVLTSSGMDFTRQKGRTFTKVEPTLDGNVEMNDLNVSLVKEDKMYRRQTLDESVALIKLDEFTSTRVVLEHLGDQAIIEQPARQMFALPGAVYPLTTQVREVMSDIVVLDDAQGQPVLDVQCIGPGCVGVEPLSSDGVFRVNYQKNSQFELVAKGEPCRYQPSPKGYAEGVCM